MNNERGYSPEDVTRAMADLIVLGEFSVEFARVPRKPVYPDGRQETDVEHSFHLAISAVELGDMLNKKLGLNLDLGLIAQFSLVHDSPEVIVGDVPTFDISAEDRARKEQAESEAVERLLEEFPSKTAELLERYEAQVETEAQFVRFVDKLTPAVINIITGDPEYFAREYGVETAQQLNANRQQRTAWLKQRFSNPDFEFLFDLRDALSQEIIDTLFVEAPEQD